MIQARKTDRSTRVLIVGILGRADPAFIAFEDLQLPGSAPEWLLVRQTPTTSGLVVKPASVITRAPSPPPASKVTGGSAAAFDVTRGNNNQPNICGSGCPFQRGRGGRVAGKAVSAPPSRVASPAPTPSTIVVKLPTASGAPADELGGVVISTDDDFFLRRHEYTALYPEFTAMQEKMKALHPVFLEYARRRVSAARGARPAHSYGIVLPFTC